MADIASRIIQSDHFVYKAGTHGPEYLDKELLATMGARNLVEVINEVGNAALRKGLDLGNLSSKIGIVGPAMGAITFSLTLAAHLEKLFSIYTFFPARTELTEDKSGKKVHIIPDKLKPIYQGSSFIIFEDIINNGTTVREVGKLFDNVIAAICICDRRGQTAESLEVKQYYPYLRFNMEQSTAKDCDQCLEGIPINTKLGKGARWVSLFGQPPYPDNKDFSLFWE
ncbi:hypothetical protein AUJ27_01725 [Candidatus Falkowbacteria bacterium CG1_02_37_44]|uniref:Phosphoribosyltransferase domain-containing protein n=1 Tax=Candidatus Falkowbacteria bacterium CG1_02_37_44 TaxID=1805146 RepID=A0A1J4T8L4_9BACT|nr:MAG: hypothetical protein AUJ27_01725 [Candidatus Falkowbacteria bacterium CG1_02_37_44]